MAKTKLCLNNEKKSNIHSKPTKPILYFQDPPPTLTDAPHFENLTYFYRKRAFDCEPTPEFNIRAGLNPRKDLSILHALFPAFHFQVNPHRARSPISRRRCWRRNQIFAVFPPPDIIYICIFVLEFIARLRSVGCVLVRIGKKI